MGSARFGSLVVRPLLAGVCFCATGAAAAPEGSPGAEPQPASPRGTRLEVTATELPRLDRVDAPAGGMRLDLTYLPERRSAVGLAMGVSGFGAAGAGPATPGLAAAGPAAHPLLDVGVHWRHQLDNNYRLDITAWRRVGPEPHDLALGSAREPTYGARLELNLKPSRKLGWVADRGFLGVQLQGGGRITVKRKYGGPMIYYRTSF